MYQHADAPLLATDKLPLGGVRTIRGYRENLLVRDNGVSLSLDWQLPINIGNQKIDLTLFSDYGESWDQDVNLPTHNAAIIRSLGFTVDWSPIENLSASFTYAHGFDRAARENQDLQDKGIHFALRYSVF